MSGTRDGGSVEAAIDQNVYDRPPVRIPCRSGSLLLSSRIRTTRWIIFEAYDTAVIVNHQCP